MCRQLGNNTALIIFGDLRLIRTVAKGNTFDLVYYFPIPDVFERGGA